jgi:hypothetical protein
MRKRILVITVVAIASLALVLAFVANQALVNSHMYPQDALHENANLSVMGIVTSVEQNHKTQGMLINSYHMFRLFIRLNITEVRWTSEDYLNSSVGGEQIFGSNSISVGYDGLKNLQLAIGQEIECKGFYFGATDSPYSFILTVAPTVSDSHLNLYYA